MSAKWERVREWDKTNLTGPLLPVRWIMMAFSSITLAVFLLVGISLYGALASVPVGMLALIPTQLFYFATLVILEVFFLVSFFWFVRVALRSNGSPSTVFLIKVIGGLITAALAAFLWWWLVLPVIIYQPGDPSTGVQFFSEFALEYRTILIRQLPSWEMTEIEFYAWWPFRLAMILFVVNLVVATIRRTEFIWLNIGVLSVHGGIVVLALGSLIYGQNKVEGSIILLRNGSELNRFYDNIACSLYGRNAETGKEIEFPLPRLSRYNDAPQGTEYAPSIELHKAPSYNEVFPENLEATIVGIIPYGQPINKLIDGGPDINPSILVNITGEVEERDQILWSGRLRNDPRAEGTVHDVFTIQHLPVPSERRYQDLTTPFPKSGNHMVIVRLPEIGFKRAFTVAIGEEVDITGTGWTMRVVAHQPGDEGLPLITTGYRGCSTSRLMVEIEGPDDQSFTRHIMHRYPELSQDFTEAGHGEVGGRQAADLSQIDLTYIDASRIHMYIVQPDPLKSEFDFIRRDTDGSITTQTIGVEERVSVGWFSQTEISLEVRDLWTHTTTGFDIEPVPFEHQEKESRGSYFDGFINIEMSMPRDDGSVWTHQEWFRFQQYPEPIIGAHYVPVEIPDVGRFEFCFGRRRQPLPGISLKLADFEMIPYPGTDTPRDYVSTIQVISEAHPVGEIHKTQLNYPYIYRVPFSWDDDRFFLSNIGRWLLGLVAPDQYKFSQSGWDPDNEAYTILGVGNNPGIYVIAIGSIIMTLGVPWAFYIKPAVIKRRNKRTTSQ